MTYEEELERKHTRLCLNYSPTAGFNRLSTEEEKERKAFITQRIKPKWKRDCGMAACV